MVPLSQGVRKENRGASTSAFWDVQVSLDSAGAPDTSV